MQRTIEATPEKVEKITLATIALHNYSRQTDTATYTPTGFIDSEDYSGQIKDGLWRNELNSTLTDVRPGRPQKGKNSAVDTREALAQYFVSEEGSVPWQTDYIQRTGN